MESEERQKIFIVSEIEKLSQSAPAIQKIKRKVDNLWNAASKKNIIVFGIPEAQNEAATDMEMSITELFTKIGVADVLFDDMYRIGKPGSKSRPLMIKLLRFWDKRKIIRNKLKGTKVFINDDLGKEDKARNSILRNHLKTLQKQDKTKTGKILRNGTLQVAENGSMKIYVVNESGLVVHLPDAMESS